MAWKPFNFFKYDPEKDGNQTFNIEKALNENWDHTEELVKEARERLETAEENMGGYQEKPEEADDILEASKWNQETKTYSFEEEFPNNEYDIIVELNGGQSTDEQTEAWDAANIKGNYPENILYAKGDVPAIDIPIIRQVIKK